MKAKSNLFLILIVAFTAIIAGCNEFVDYITPAHVDHLATTYTTDDPNAAGWCNLSQAKDIKRDIIITHRDNQTQFMRTIEDDKTAYNDAFDIVTSNISKSQMAQKLILEGDGGLNPGLYSILFGASGLLAGRNFLKRPGDITPDGSPAKT